MSLVAGIHLVYQSDSRGSMDGWYLPAADLSNWILAAAAESPNSTQYYLAPRSIEDNAAVGLIALRSGERANEHAVPAGAIPLTCHRNKSSECSLWLPWLTQLSGCVTPRELFDKLSTRNATHFVWLPSEKSGKDRLIGLTDEDAIDLSVLIKPPNRNSSVVSMRWLAPPIVMGLPDHVSGLQISSDLLPPDLFEQEQQFIGGNSNDLMAIDDEGRPTGGGIGAMFGRLFRHGLSKVIQAIEDRKRNAESQTHKSKGDSASSRPARQQPKPRKVSAPLINSLMRQMQKLLASQREKQLNKLLALMARDPDRALKYAVPMSAQAAHRGIAPPGGALGSHQVDFSLSRLFGGGRPIDAWEINQRLQAKLRATYREQADRELAAGRYRRAAYIFAHLLGDLASAAAVLEKGKFFVEAEVLYKHLKRPLDRARCLRNSGQLAEAASLYESIQHFETAAEMWLSVGDRLAASAAYEKACEAALKARDILKAVGILENQLHNPARAEQLLWEQWPGGVQVMECMKAAFARLAEQGRASEARSRLEDVIARAERTHHTLLALLCASLHKSFPDLELRRRAEDQCRLSSVDHVHLLRSDELRQRMNAISSLHADDLLLQRDVRRFEREHHSDELQLQPVPGHEVKRGSLVQVSSLRLVHGHHFAARMIRQQLLTVSVSDQTIHFTRYADLTSDSPRVNRCHSRANLWDSRNPLCCHHDSNSDPVNIRVGYVQTPVQSLLLTSPLGGDDFWVINPVESHDCLLAGIGEDGSQWFWNAASQQAVRRTQGQPKVIECAEAIAQATRYNANHQFDPAPGLIRQQQLVVHSRQLFWAHQNTLFSVKENHALEVTSFDSAIGWIVPSLPQTRPRLLVATDDSLYEVPLDSRERKEKILSNEAFTTASFLPGGCIAAATKDELLLFRRGNHAIRLIDRKPLQTAAVVAILRITAETIGVLYEHGVLERWRINL